MYFLHNLCVGTRLAAIAYMNWRLCYVLLQFRSLKIAAQGNFLCTFTEREHQVTLQKNKWQL